MHAIVWATYCRLVPFLAFLMGILPAGYAGAQMPTEEIHLEIPASGATAAMTLIDDQPSIEVEVNGKGPFTFLVDTGAAGGGRIDPELAARLGLEKVGQVLAGDPSGRNGRMRDVVRVDRITFAGVEARRVPVLMASDIGDAREIAGILGFALFRDVLLTLDYPAGELRVAPGELPDPDGREVLEDIGGRGIPAVEIDVGGVRVPADIDSGSMGWVMIPAELAGELELASEPVVVGRASTSFNTFDILQAPLDGVMRVGRHAMENPPVDFADMFPRGNLGGQFLTNFAVTFDQRNRRVRFASDEAVQAEKPRRYRVGIMFGTSPDGMSIQGTVPGSPGSRAGLQEGDVVLAINGRAPADIPRSEMSGIFGKPEPVTLKLRRRDAELTVTLTPEER